MAAEAKRGCGYRKIGGIYLVSDAIGVPCHRLPIPLEVCPTCHGGIKQARGWTWVHPDILGGQCKGTRQTIKEHCVYCVACSPHLLGEKAGLLWIGEQFYKTPQEFTVEANKQGVSRRISAVPKGFKVGEHYVLVAHPKAILKANGQPPTEGELIGKDKHIPGIFHVFKPTAIEKILPDNASQRTVKQWENKGFKVVLLPHDDPDHGGKPRKVAA